MDSPPASGQSRAGPRRWRNARAAGPPCLAIAAVLLAAACDARAPVATGPFTVSRVRPAAGSAVFLNQPLAIYFTEPVDALSVTPDTVRVVDEDGHAVPMHELEVGSQVVTLHPRPPMTAALDDGSFVPGRTYWLEIAGYPQVNSVRSRQGRTLARGLRHALAVVSRQGDLQYPRPLLPVGVGNEPFLLDPTRRLDVQAGTGLLRLHFTLPPYPPSVQPQAFTVQRLDRRLNQVHALEVAAAHVVRDPSDPYPGCTVELQLAADPEIAVADLIALFLREGEDGVVDYAGRTLTPHGTVTGAGKQVHVRAGPALELARVTAAQGARLEPADLARPGFEACDRARFVPRVRVAAGSGAHGLLRPEASMRLGPGELGLAGTQHADATLELSGLEVLPGVRLTLTGFTTPVRIRVTGSVRIAGELVLETPRAAVRDFVDPMAHVWPIRDDDLPGLAGCVIVAAGDIEITGHVEHVQEHERMGPALALVAGGRLTLRGRIPPDTVCGSEAEVLGNLQAGRVRPVRLRPGHGGGAPVIAAANTEWVRIPGWVQGPVGGAVLGGEAGVEVLWQTAPPHALDPARPDPRSQAWSQPRPLGESITGGAGQFVRFLLRARIEPGQRRLPGIAGVVLSVR